MSHYADIEVDFDQKNEKELVAALEEQFGEGTVEVHEKGAPLMGWHGDDRSKLDHKNRNWAPPCELIIRRKNVGSASNDLGFQRVENGKYKAWVSDYDQSSNFGKDKLGRVTQEYALRVAEHQLKTEGWTKIWRQKLDDGSVKITAKDQVKVKNW